MQKGHITAKDKGGNVLGEADYQIAENLKEASTIVGGDDEVLKLFNQAHKTNTRNKLAKPAGSGGVVKKEAYACYKRLLESTKMSKTDAMNITKLTTEEVASFEKKAAA